MEGRGPFLVGICFEPFSLASLSQLQADLVGFPGDSSPVKSPSSTDSPQAGSGSVTTRPRQRTAQCYFVSKQLWAKGYRLLFELLAHYRATKCTVGGVAVDLYGSGPDSAAIGEKAVKTKLDVQMKGYADHAKLGQYKVDTGFRRRRGLSFLHLLYNLEEHDCQERLQLPLPLLVSMLHSFASLGG